MGNEVLSCLAYIIKPGDGPFGSQKMRLMMNINQYIIIHVQTVFFSQ